jgi:hypothetical protein
MVRPNPVIPVLPIGLTPRLPVIEVVPVVEIPDLAGNYVILSEPRFTAAGPTPPAELELELELEVEVEVGLEVDVELELELVLMDEVLEVDCNWKELEADDVDDFKALDVEVVDVGEEVDEMDVVEPGRI